MRRGAPAAAALCLWAAAAAGDPGTVFDAIAIRDTGGFAPGVTALTVRAPSDWHSRGGVRWTANPACVAMPASVVFSTLRADGLAGYHLMPGVMRAWSSDPAASLQHERAASPDAVGCLAPGESFGVQAWLDEVFLDVYRRDRADARILSARRLTAIADAIEARLAGEIGAAAFDRLREAGGEARVYGDAGIFDIGYTADGRPIRERVFVSLAVTEISLPRPGGGTVAQSSSFTDKVVSWHAPEEEFEALAPTFGFMLASTVYNQRWTDAVAQAIRRIRSRTDSDLVRVHERNAGAADFVSEQIDAVPAASAALIGPADGARIPWIRDRRAMVNPWDGAVFDVPADAGGRAFYVNGLNQILIADDPNDVDGARWMRLLPRG